MKMGFIEALTLILIVLKLLGKVSFSWLVVLSPLIGFYTFIFLIAVVALVVKELSKR